MLYPLAFLPTLYIMIPDGIQFMALPGDRRYEKYMSMPPGIRKVILYGNEKYTII